MKRKDSIKQDLNKVNIIIFVGTGANGKSALASWIRARVDFSEIWDDNANTADYIRMKEETDMNFLICVNTLKGIPLGIKRRALIFDLNINEG